jgi:hypothetical protein
MILYIKDLKNSTKRLLDTINSFSNVARCKINLQKSLAFLYTNNEQTEKEYMTNNSIYKSLKKNKIPRNKLNKGSESYKPLKKSKKITEDGKSSHAHGAPESIF